MSDKKKKHEEEIRDDDGQIIKDNESVTMEQMKAIEEKLEALSKEKEELEAKLNEEKDKFLRLAAEYDNFKKRTAKEKMAIHSDAVADTVVTVLPIIDDMQRAFCTENIDADALKKGIDMVIKKALECFKALGVEEIDCQNKTFDPELMNAVMHIEDENAGEQTVVDVFQKGYKVGDKVIRHAMVKVAN